MTEVCECCQEGSSKLHQVCPSCFGSAMLQYVADKACEEQTKKEKGKGSICR